VFREGDKCSIRILNSHVGSMDFGLYFLLQVNIHMHYYFFIHNNQHSTKQSYRNNGNNSVYNYLTILTLLR
jgi:hypothetical protein